MLKLDYIVRVYVGGDTDVPSIGLAGGVCTWATADQTLSVLADNWIGSITDSVDTSVSGQYAKYSDVTISINKSAIVEILLKNQDLTLNGSRIEIFETDGVTEKNQRRGVIRNSKEVGNTVSLTVSHVANYYVTNMTTRVGGDYSSLVYGDSVDRVKTLFVESESVDNLTIGDGLSPSFVVEQNSSNGINLFFRSVYDSDSITLQDLQDFIDSNDYILGISENELLLNLKNATASFKTVSGKQYAGTSCIIVPMNRKDTSEENYLKVDDTFIAEAAGYDKYFTPYGATIDATKLEYKSGSTYFPMPHYLDSLVVYSDRLEILDADGEGDLYIEPTNDYKWGYGGAPDAVNGILYNNLISRGVYATNINGSTFNVISVEYETEDTMSTLTDDNTGGLVTVNIGNDGSPNEGEGVVQVVNSYTFNPSRIDSDEVYFTSNIDCVDQVANFVNTDHFQYTVYVTTVNETFTIAFEYEGENENFTGSWLSNIIPLTPSNSDINKRYRWENTTLFGSGKLGNSIKILENVVNEWEKSAPITVTTVLEFYGIGGLNSRGDYLSAKVRTNLVAPVSYARGDIYTSGVSGRSDSSDTSITNTADAYLSTLELQNYSTLGIDIPSLGWGLEYPVTPVSIAIDPLLSIPSIDLAYQTDETGTNTVKYDMLKYTTSIGTLNSDGLETVRSVLSMYDTGGFLISKHLIKGVPTITQIDPTRIYPEIGVAYAGGNINITNVEQEFFDLSYVTGITDFAIAEGLWRCGWVLYKKYGMKNSYPKNLSNISGIKNEADAIAHIEGQYRIMGVTRSDRDAVLNSRYKAVLSTGNDIVYDQDLVLGDNVTFDYPNIASMDTANIVKIGKANLTGVTTLTLDCVGEALIASASFEYIESGTQPNDIPETATQPDNIKEAI